MTLNEHAEAKKNARELVSVIISAYNTKRLIGVPPEDHILSKPRVIAALQAFHDGDFDPTTLKGRSA